tara:strand:- start:4916 stop:6376 length:1461 start_codon:yes stop_codon:yes gene_type:complete
MIKIKLKDKKIFGNEAGEDEDLDVLNSYYIDHPNSEDFFDPDEKLSVVSARKGMGKSALLSRLEYKLINDASYGKPLIIRVKGNELLGLGDFSGSDHTYLENYWKKIICKRIIVEIGKRIDVALSSDEMSLVELSEIEGLKSKNIIGGLVARVKAKFSGAEISIEDSIPRKMDAWLQRYQEGGRFPNIWILIDDIDAKFRNTEDNQARVGAFFSAIRSLSFETKGLNIRTTVRSDVWSCLRHLEDLDKLQQYIFDIVWNKKHMRDMLTKKISIYINREFSNSKEAKYKPASDYNKILDTVFHSPIEWAGNSEARMFDAISAFSNRRPRWMGQLCRMAGKKAAENINSKKINLDHVNYILSDFGALRRDDLIKEHSHQFEELTQLIDSLRATKKEFTYKDLSSTLEKTYIRKRKKEDIPDVDGKRYVDCEDLGDFLYKIGVVSRCHEDGKTFTHYTDDPDLYRSNENREDRIIWSIHPAYRTFLNIK